ncbi:MAG: TolC family protein, partial [Burkholderiales bacterium]
MGIAIKRLILLGLLTSILKSYAFDLNAAYQHALVYNADYLTAVAQNQAGQEQQAQGLAALLPNFSAQAAYTENYLNSNMVVYYHQPTLSAQFQQVIFDLGKFSQYTKSKFATQIAELQLADAKQKLMLKVAQAYFDLLYANDTRAAIRYTRIALAKQLNQAKTAFNVGTVTIADVNDTKAAFDSASAQELQADNELINQETLFHNLTGLNANLIQPLAKNILLIAPVPSKIEQWVQMAKVHNKTLKIATTQLAMALADIRIAKANHMPTVKLSG